MVSAPVLARIPTGCAKEQLHCMLDRIPAYKCFFCYVVLYTDPWLCLGTGLGFFWGPEGPPLMGEGETVSWIQKVHEVRSCGTRSPIPPVQPRLQKTWLSPTCSLWMLRKHPAK